MEPRQKLYRSRSDRMIAGVCGGVAEYLSADPAIVRVLWALSVLLGGAGIILYVAAILIMPADPVGKTAEAPRGRTRFWGFLLIGLGVVLLVDNVVLFPFWDMLTWQTAVAILLLAAGMILIASHFRERRLAPADAGTGASHEPPRRLSRSVRDRKILGVCGGVAEYLHIDSTIVRLLFVALLISSFGFTLLAYIVLGVILPEELPGTTTA